jgi:hypothetical protein
MELRKEKLEETVFEPSEFELLLLLILLSFGRDFVCLKGAFPSWFQCFQPASCICYFTSLTVVSR